VSVSRCSASHDEARMSDVAVITGTTHGIGQVTAHELARAGREVVMLCRDISRGALIREEILAHTPAARVHVLHCDLALLASVRECAAAVRSGIGRIGLLINNAGIAPTRHRRSPDGFELAFATNHLGPFLLTALLLDRLEAPARIINVASRVHQGARFDLQAIPDPNAPFRSTVAYARSKLANVLHAFALARRLSGTGITANCLHPGVVRTNLLPRWLELIRPLIRRNILDAHAGARTTLHLALAGEVAALTGRYFDEHQVEQRADARAYEVTQQEALWEVSSRWTGLRC
jgi:NAD(P)-dependent dehydrogenase (short-subunit alcohol dehydrogenase family)